MNGQFVGNGQGYSDRIPPALLSHPATMTHQLPSQPALVHNSALYPNGSHYRNFPISSQQSMLLPPTSRNLPFPSVPMGVQPNTSINRSQRCGVCRGCQCKPCGTCTYCQDSPQFGGPGVKKQSCIERRCLRVLENRLQRDAPTFKARTGCGKCDDCRMPDCQVCLVCLDKRFFANRYMTGALCHKKRCNNSVGLETTHPPAAPVIKFQQKRSLVDQATVEEFVAKRRDMAYQAFHEVNSSNNYQTTPASQSAVAVAPVSEDANSVKMDLNGAGEKMKSNCDIATIPTGMYAPVYSSAGMQSLASEVSAMKSLLNMNTAERILPANSDINGGIRDNTASLGLTELNQPPLPSLCNGSSLQQSAYLLAPLPGLQSTNFSYIGQVHQSLHPAYAYNQQEPQIKYSMLDYPKYEYGDEIDRLYRYGNVIPPPDPFVPPSYSSADTNIVLQPL